MKNHTLKTQAEKNKVLPCKSHKDWLVLDLLHHSVISSLKRESTHNSSIKSNNKMSLLFGNIHYHLYDPKNRRHSKLINTETNSIIVIQDSPWFTIIDEKRGSSGVDSRSGWVKVG